MLIYIKKSLNWILKNPIITLQVIFYWILSKLHLIKQNYVKIYWKNIFLLLPKSMSWMAAIEETYVENIYKFIVWYNNVLDIWWFLWETAIWFSEYNKNVVVYEADTDNFIQLQKVINQKNNITAYNYAVIDNKSNHIYFDDQWWHNVWWHVNIGNKWKKIPAIYVEDIFNDNIFDAIKIDIEWSEYSILKKLKSFNWNSIKAGYIEFHFNHGTESKQDKLKIINHYFNLFTKWYELSYMIVWKNKYIQKNDLIHYIQNWSIDVFLFGFRKLWSQ